MWARDLHGENEWAHPYNVQHFKSFHSSVLQFYLWKTTRNVLLSVLFGQAGKQHTHAVHLFQSLLPLMTLSGCPFPHILTSYRLHWITALSHLWCHSPSHRLHALNSSKSLKTFLWSQTFCYPSAQSFTMSHCKAHWITTTLSLIAKHIQHTPATWAHFWPLFHNESTAQCLLL